MIGKEMDARPSCVGDAMPSVAGYYEQELLVARCFAFLHVLTIFFGLFVDAASRDGSAAEVCVDSCAAPTRFTCMCVCGKKAAEKKYAQLGSVGRGDRVLRATRTLKKNKGLS